MIMLSFHLVAALLLLSSVLGASAMHEELPTNNRDWFSLSPVLEFQPAMDIQDPTIRHAIHRVLSQSTSGYENQFIDGTGTYYNDYAQAWRLLGFYLDCNAPANNFNECNDNGDGQVACQRYLMWAAYIDLDYAGGGIGEYEFYNRETQSWDDTSCVASNGRCAKMDCHLKDTNFKLLGFFKEPNYHEWMEQLFKHQGVCLWTDEEYALMDADRYLWPCYCTNTGQTDENGNTLYYDTKPMPEGRIGLGLYTDAKCSQDYTGDKDIANVLSNVDGDQNDYGSVYELARGLAEWNDAFDVFKICQPCKAYNLGYNKDLTQGGRQGGDYDEDGRYFDCYDDANYVNVNQCMKFKTKTEMLAADFRDIMLAHEQGNIVEVEVMGYTYGYGGFRESYGTLSTKFTMSGRIGPSPAQISFLVLSLLFVAFAGFMFYKAKSKETPSPMKTPLVSPEKGALA